MPNYTGTEGNDTHTGTGDAEIILGLGGNDNLSGAGGDDEIDGGSGDDILNGNDGNDTLVGGDGNDQLRGNAGNDQLDGGAGNDLLRGNIGIDSYVGGTGGETWGSGYGDRISFYDAAATAGVIADLRNGVITNDGFGNVEAMSGIESLGGDTAFVDTFYGNDSSNFFQANRGDLLYGFGGTDAFSMSSAVGIVDGGDGTDVLWLDLEGGWLLPDSNGDGQAELSPASMNGWNINLATGAMIDGFGNAGSVTAIEYVTGSSLHDTITGSGNADHLAGNVGDDTINGGDGNDVISGDGVFDIVNGVITLVASSVPAPGGSDTLTGGAGNDTIFGGDGNDQLRGGDGDDQMDAGTGNDLLRGNIGTDSYAGGTGGEAWGNGYGDRISFYDAAATAGVFADLRNGVISNDGFGNVESMTGIESLGSDTAFADTFYGNDGSNFFQANRGDSLYGFASTDAFAITSAAAVVDGGDGTDVLWLNNIDGWLLPDTNGDGFAELAPIATSGWNINLATGALVDGYGNSGFVTAIEYVTGANLNDVMTGGDNADSLAGNVGNDTISGGGGNDVISGDGEFQFVNGVITLMPSSLPVPGGNDILNGGDGNDTIDGGAGQDQAFGEAGDDILVVSAAPVAGEIFNGGTGTDTIRFLASAGNLTNTINGQSYLGSLIPATLSGLERIEFGSISGFGLGITILTNQLAAGFTVTPELVGGAGNDGFNIVAGSSGTYTIANFTYSNWTNADEAFETGDVVALIGTGTNNYTLNAATGHLGVQALIGALGNDTLNGTDGLEVLNGGGGVNTLNAGGGDDILVAANSTPFGGSQTNFFFTNNVYNGGGGFDWLSIGGFVEFQGELNSIEGINLQAAFTATAPSTASQTEAELLVDWGAFDLVPANLALRGTGILSLRLGAGDVIDASGWVHTAGSNVFIQFFGSDDGGETVIGTSGNDRFSPSFGTGTFTGGAGNDQFEAGEGQVTVTDFTIGQDRVDLQDMNFTSFAQLLPYLSQQDANVVFSRMYGGVAQTMTLLNVNLANLSASDFIFQTGNDGDTRIGTDQVDDLIGAGGNDNLQGLGGNDFLFAGEGNDSLDGGAGNDRLEGSGGNDSLIGGDGDDMITGGDGEDTADGGAGNDSIQGDGGNDNLSGGTGNDFIQGGGGNDILVGGDGTDNLRGGAGDDQMDGGVGNDLLGGGAGVDIYVGGSGGEVWGGGYGDRISFYERGATAAVVVDLRTGVISNDGFGNVESATGIESLGSDTAFADTFYGNDGSNFFQANRGDFLHGFGGMDGFSITSAAIVDGGNDTDVLWLNNFADWLLPDSNGDGLAEFAPAATIGWNINLATGALADGYGNVGGVTGIEYVTGSGLADSITGSGNADHLGGNLGIDTINGGGGNDVISGDGIFDFVGGILSLTTSNLVGQTSSDTLTGGGGDDTFAGTTGGQNGDTITDFNAGDRIVFTDASLGSFTFSLNGNTLTYAGGTMTLTGFSGTLVASAAANGGVQLTVQTGPADVRNDFNGDGRSDILWRYVDGTIGNWLANANGTHTTNGPSVTPAPSSWNIAGTGDFNGDGRDDILWRSNAGEVGSWTANADGSHSYNAAAGVTLIPLSWQVEAVGDFNADGKDDILWRNTDGTVGVWSGQTGGSFVANNAAVFNVSTDWQIVGTGDFNGDGKDDILWRHDSGTFADWLANDSGGFTPNNPSLVAISSDWHIIGTGDFNGDGRDDILWRHDSGTVANWSANSDGTFSPNFASLVTITNDWNVASIGDYNGDGRDDILWRHDSGTVANWLANSDNSGTFTTNEASFAGIPNEWQVQDPAILVL